MLKKPLFFARDLVAAALKNGGRAVDATCGNGHDTVFLAEHVGPHGLVQAFDIQPQAILATRQRLTEAGLLERVQLIEASHANIESYCHENLQAVMFNLGYLPGGNHAVVTQPESTLTALRFAAEKLNSGGIITVVAYTGHEGGMDEFKAVRHFAAALPQQRFTVLEYSFINQVNHPPLLLAVSRL